MSSCSRICDCVSSIFKSFSYLTSCFIQFKIFCYLGKVISYGITFRNNRIISRTYLVSPFLRKLRNKHISVYNRVFQSCKPTRNFIPNISCSRFNFLTHCSICKIIKFVFSVINNTCCFIFYSINNFSSFFNSRVDNICNFVTNSNCFVLRNSFSNCSSRL